MAKAPAKARPGVEAANQYAKHVVAGKIPACRYVRLACQRHLDDLARQRDPDFPYVFDADACERILKFAQLLPHVKGEWAFKRQLITLAPWQCFGIGVPFGWKRKADGLRRFREIYKEVPRKNGKSIDAAVVGLYMLAIDEEAGPEVYSGATTEKQAWEVFRPAKLMAEKSPALLEAKGIEVRAKQLYREHDAGRFEPVIGKPGDGSSPHCAIVDEYHEHDDASLYETMITGMGARRQPLMYVITTAGFNVEGPCYDMRRRAIAMLEGNTPDDQLFAVIYTIDEGDDWTDPAVLAKANPNMGISVYADYLISQQELAVKNAAKQNAFKTKHLNVWVSARAAYFNLETWNACEDKALSLDQFAGQPCYLALDLASKLDLAAVIPVFVRDIDGKKHYYVTGCKFYLPEAAIEWGNDPGSVARFSRWANEGWITLMAGAENDFGSIAQDVVEFNEQHQVREVPHDPWGAFELAHTLEQAGLLPVKIPQAVSHLSPAMKELQAAIESGRLHHDGNPVLRWCIGNVTAREDANENVFPRKERPENKIDGAVALIMGISRAMVGVDDRSVYEDRGLLIL